MAKKLDMVTPRGIAVYPHLHAPDTKFDEAGIYSAKLHFDLDDDGVSELIGKIDEEWQAGYDDALAAEEDPKKRKKIKKQADKPYSIDEEENEVEINFKMRASGVSKKDGRKWTRSPKLIDAAGAMLPKGTKVGGGSILKVGFNFSRFYTALVGGGVSLRLEVVQVLELKVYSAFDFANSDFEVEEGGFSADDLSEDAVATDEPKAAAAVAGETTGGTSTDADAEAEDF